MEKFNWKISLFGVCFTWLVNLMLLPKLTFHGYIVVCTIFSIAMVLIVNIQWMKENL